MDAGLSLISGADQDAPGLIEPPNNAEVEAALLGNLLRRNDTYDAIEVDLQPEHFYWPEHRAVFEAIQNRAEAGKEFTPTHLGPWAEADPLIKEAGGKQFLFTLAANVISVLNTDDYAKTVIDYWRKRNMMAAAQELLARINEDVEADDLAAAHEDMLDQIHVEEDSAVKSLKHYAGEALKQAEAAMKGERRPGLSTGFPSLDKLIGGLYPGELTIIAGRPSMGKTALTMNIMRAAAQSGKTALIHSLEMSGESLATRLLAEFSGVSSSRLRRGKFDMTDFVQDIGPANEALAELPIVIDERPAASASQIRKTARRVSRKQGLSLICVDYLQLMREAGDHRNRVEAIGRMTGALKALAKELEIPVIVLSQLNRQVELRDDKRPVLADLRDSGAIEQDADNVLLLYREGYYLERQEPNDTAKWPEWRERLDGVKNRGDVIVAKQRSGPIGSVSLRWNGALTTFSDPMNDPMTHTTHHAAE